MSRATRGLRRIVRGHGRLTLAAAVTASLLAGAAVVTHTVLRTVTPAHAQQSQSIADQLGIPGLTDHSFAVDGVALHAPSAGAPVSRHAAEQTVTGFVQPAGTVVSSVLADVDSRYMQDGKDAHGFDNPRLCWVVVVKTTAVLAPLGHVTGAFTPSPENMEIAMVDAKTGRLIGVFRDGGMPVIK